MERNPFRSCFFLEIRIADNKLGKRKDTVNETRLRSISVFQGCAQSILAFHDCTICDFSHNFLKFH